MDAETRWWTRLIAYIALASLGGVLGYIMRALDQDQRPSLFRSIMEGVAAGFAGVILLLLCQALEVDEKMIGVIVGVGGWLGASATIRRLEPIALGALNHEPKIHPGKHPSSDRPRRGGFVSDPVDTSGTAQGQHRSTRDSSGDSEEINKPP